MNTFLSFSWRNRLPQQQYDLLKAPLITALGDYNSKTALWDFLRHQILISMIRRNFWQSVKKKKQHIAFRATLKFWRFKVALNPKYSGWHISSQVCRWPVADMGKYSIWWQMDQSKLVRVFKLSSFRHVNNSLCTRKLQNFTKPEDSQL